MQESQRMNKLLWILLLIALNAVITEGSYTTDDIDSIVVHHAMPFWTFPQDYHQYGVLILLPADKSQGIKLVPSPGVLNEKHEYSSYDKQLIKGDVLVGINYAVARPSEGGNVHTETQLLDQLPYMLKWYEVEFKTHPTAVLLYTRGTPCTGCTDAISYARKYLFQNGQFIVAYTKNLVNSYMDPTLNCKNRVLLRWYYEVSVLCVKEQYNENIGKNQCLEDDFKVPCNEHNQVYKQQ